MEYRAIETFPFLLDTCLEKPESNETWTVAEMTQYLYLTSEAYPLATQSTTESITYWKRY